MMRKLVSFILAAVMLMSLLPVTALAAGTSALPAGYTQLPYITCDGGAYFDSGVQANGKTRVEAKFRYELDGCFLYGVSSTDNLATLSCCLTGSGGRWRLMDKTVTIPLKMGTVYETVQDADGVSVSGKLYRYEEEPNEEAVSPATVAIGDLNTKTGTPCSNAYQFRGEIYYLRILENGETIRDYVPCTNSSGVAGLYDRVTGTFCRSTGTETFGTPQSKGDTPYVYTVGALVLNADTGEIYYGKNINAQSAAASTAKIMTCILVLESLDLNRRTPAAVKGDLVNGSSMGLALGESLTVQDALYGLMLPSGCDAAMLLARAVSGSYSGFVRLMNQKAAELGMTKTKYTSPSGLTVDSTSPYDLAVITNYAMRNPMFRKIVATQRYYIKADAYGARNHTLTNTNKLLSSYDGATGVKTGTTTACHLVSSASRNGVNLIAVVQWTNSSNRYTDSIKLLDYGFKKAEEQPYTVTSEGDTLHIYNPKTGYRLTETIAAEDGVYTGKACETAFVETVGTTDRWIPYPAITYRNNVEPGTAQASITFMGKTASTEFSIIDMGIPEDPPNTPDTPVVPDQPDIPNGPTEPEEPNQPGTPGEPTEPEEPGQVDTPDEPTVPDNPVTMIPPQQALPKFTDVPKGAYFEEAVNWAFAGDITKGTTDTTFSPKMTCSRAQTVTFLWRAAGSPAPIAGKNPFTDVKKGDYYYDAVLWAAQQGITNGVTQNTFGPKQTVDRGQTVTLLWRAANSPKPASTISQFTDIRAKDYYYSAVLWAVEHGITNGTAPKSFSPKQGCTRGQIVTFLYRNAAS